MTKNEFKMRALLAMCSVTLKTMADSLAKITAAIADYEPDA